MGYWIALLGVALALGLSCVGSSVGVGFTGQAAAGLVAEHPERAGKVTVLVALPATQGLYGMAVAFIALLSLGLFDGGLDFASEAFTAEAGWAYFMACLPMAIGGLVSGIFQGRVAASGINLYARREEGLGSAIIFSGIVEIYALLSLVISAITLLMIA